MHKQSGIHRIDTFPASATPSLDVLPDNSKYIHIVRQIVNGCARVSYNT